MSTRPSVAHLQRSTLSGNVEAFLRPAEKLAFRSFPLSPLTSLCGSDFSIVCPLFRDADSVRFFTVNVDDWFGCLHLFSSLLSLNSFLPPPSGGGGYCSFCRLQVDFYQSC